MIEKQFPHPDIKTNHTIQLKLSQQNQTESNLKWEQLLCVSEIYV